MSISNAEIELIAQRAAEVAVEKVLAKYGIDTSDPIESQADMDHLRRWRKAVNSAATTGFVATIGILVSGLLAATWLGIQMMFGKPPG